MDARAIGDEGGLHGLPRVERVHEGRVAVHERLALAPLERQRLDLDLQVVGTDQAHQRLDAFALKVQRRPGHALPELDLANAVLPVADQHPHALVREGRELGELDDAERTAAHGRLARARVERAGREGWRVESAYGISHAGTSGSAGHPYETESQLET